MSLFNKESNKPNTEEVSLSSAIDTIIDAIRGGNKISIAVKPSDSTSSTKVYHVIPTEDEMINPENARIKYPSANTEDDQIEPSGNASIDEYHNDIMKVYSILHVILVKVSNLKIKKAKVKNVTQYPGLSDADLYKIADYVSQKVSGIVNPDTFSINSNNDI